MTLEEDTISRIHLLKGAVWTALVFGIGQILRLGSNIILARLLAPELFGLMQIVYSFRSGIELLSDVGIHQNIIHNRNANDPDFYNTAWTLQLVRGIILWIIFCIIAFPISEFYRSPILLYVMPVTAFSVVLSGFSSASYALCRKWMKFRALAVFDTIVALIFYPLLIVFAVLSPTIWALAFGTLAGATISAIGTHFLLKQVRHRFFISKKYVNQILSFGKWIFISSIVFFLSTNFDRLYLAKAIPLELLGVYGIARTLSELFSAAVLQLGGSVIFPFISSHSQMPRRKLREQLSPIRMKFLLVAGIGFSLFAVMADLIVGILYDQRYQAAGWMLPVLIIGGWFAVMCNLNESTLLGLGKPSYGALANSAKLAFLLVGLPICVTRYGVFGGVLVVAVSDLSRYVPIIFGKIRERFSFVAQDLFITLAVFALIALWEWLRWAAGYGTSFKSLPVNIFSMFGA